MDRKEEIMYTEKCNICGEPLEPDFRKWTLTFQYCRPRKIPKEEMHICHDCKIEIRDYIKRYSNIKLAERNEYK